MKPIAILGIVLLLAGLAGLFRQSHWIYRDKANREGRSDQLDFDENHSIWIPTAAAIAAMVAGAGLIAVGRK